MFVLTNLTWATVGDVFEEQTLEQLFAKLEKVFGAGNRPT